MPAALLGLAAGAVAAVTLTGPQPPPAATPRPMVEEATFEVASQGHTLPATGEAGPDAEALGVEAAVVWTSGGLPEGLAAAVAALPEVAQATVVTGDPQELTSVTGADGVAAAGLPEGVVVPLDVLGIDPQGYAAFVAPSARPLVAALRPGEALLSDTAADLRGVGAGAVLTLAGGTVLTVAGAVSDVAASGAEVLVHAGDEVVATPRFVLVVPAAAREALETAVREAAPGARALRVRGLGETPFLRHGDAVLTLAAVKATFGEFAYRDLAGRDIAQLGGWAEANLATTDLPLLGTVRCHQAVVPALEAVAEQLVAEGLTRGQVNPGPGDGCHAARRIAPGAAVSRHAWGIALDLHAASNPTGAPGHQDPRVVEAFRDHGFTWGGEWLVPDPAHFEYVGPPPG